jgi:hypothetical protein
MRFSQEYVIRVESAEASFTCRRRYSHFLALHEKVPDPSIIYAYLIVSNQILTGFPVGFAGDRGAVE